MLKATLEILLPPKVRDVNVMFLHLLQELLSDDEVIGELLKFVFLHWLLDLSGPFFESMILGQNPTHDLDLRIREAFSPR